MLERPAVDEVEETEKDEEEVTKGDRIIRWAKTGQALFSGGRPCDSQSERTAVGDNIA